jgi:ABC-type branched-subunit amino acid transport system ATPase component/ABC-type branched-subunit amino acid transport system permease subunit
VTNLLQYALLGLGVGAIYALLGQGIVLIYRGSGVLNIAQGGFAMVGAYVYLQLHAPGSLGTAYTTASGWPVVPSFAVAVAVTAVLGLATDQLLLRRMRKASPLSRLVATVCVLLVLEAVAAKLWSSEPPFVPQILPSKVWHIGSTITLPSSFVWLLCIAVALTAILTVVWRFTRIGWVTAAVSQNERGAAALGISPGFVSSATWTIGAGLAGVAGVLVAPITQASIGGLSLLVIPVLAAVLLGGFSSFPATLFSAMFVGIVQTVAVNYNSFFDKHLHVTVASDAFPLLLVVVVMLVRGTSLPTRGHMSERLPAVGSGLVRWAVVLPIVAVSLVLIFAVFSGAVLPAIAVTFTMATLLLSLVVLTGYAGQVSLAQYAIAGIGGLIAAQLAAQHGVTFLLALVCGTVGAMVVGVLLAIPALRTRGVNLAVITLAAAWAAQDMVFGNLHASGSSDGVQVGDAKLFGLDISGADQPARFAAFTFVVFVLCAIVVANIRRGRLGRRMIAVRSNERAASASGISVFRTKVTAFAISGALAGLAGTLISFQYDAISFVTFDPFTSLLVLAWIVIGGVGFAFGTLNPGALLAPGALLSLITLRWPGFIGWLPIVGGVGALVAVRFNQDGITSSNVISLHKVGDRFKRLRLAPPPGFQLDPSAHAVEPVRVNAQSLRIEGLSIRYGGVQALDSIDLRVKPGEVVGLIGPNGAGKTSLMDAVSGFTPYQGKVVLNDQRIDSWAAHRRASAGLVRSFQGLELFPELTVLENLQVPHDRNGGWQTGRELLKPTKTELSPVALAAVRDFGLGGILDKSPDEISYGQRRLVAIARAVAAEPSVLLLDEPVAGLTEHESGEFAHLVRRLADKWGMAVLVIEHDMNFVMSICDRITVINFGKLVCEGTPAEVRTNPAAVAAYLGDEPEVTELEATASESTDSESSSATTEPLSKAVPE